MKITIETDTGRKEVIECEAAQLLTIGTSNKQGDTGVCFIGTWSPEKILFMIHQLEVDVVGGAYDMLKEHFGIPRSAASAVVDMAAMFARQENMEKKVKAAQMIEALEGLGMHGNTK